MYAGDTYSIDYRYATILLNIAVAFLFGTAMPYLYLCALLAFVILYTNERLVICYFNRKPPCFDENITLETLDIIRLVPFMMLPFVFWQLGNRQIFDDKVFEKIYKRDAMLTGHSIEQSLTHANPFHMTYNSAPILLFFVLVSWKIICYFYPSKEDDESEENLIEGLASY